MGKRVIEMMIEGTRARGRRPQRRWMESIKYDLREKKLEGDEYVNKAEWRCLVRNADLLCDRDDNRSR